MKYKELSLALTMEYIMFSDEAQISDYAINAIQTMYKLRVINGVGTNTIAPKSFATRAEFAAMLNRYMALETTP
jgi:hypothetical protein